MTNSHVKDFSHLMLKVAFYYQGLEKFISLFLFNILKNFIHLSIKSL